jgi:hypothetical protein
MIHPALAAPTRPRFVTPGNPLARPSTPAPPATPRAHKIPTPEKFTGGSTAARVFLASVENYADLQPFPSDHYQIQWTLALCEGDAGRWKQQELLDFRKTPPHPRFHSWTNWSAHFATRWFDAQESNKALDKLLAGKIRQTNSVKLYNESFNEQVDLAAVPVEESLRRQYLRGLKDSVRLSALGYLKEHPRLSFLEVQEVMAEFDEELQVNINMNKNPSAPATSSSKTPAKASGNTPQTPQTPSKAAVGRTLAKLTDEERKRLRATGSCFRCRQPGHMAHECTSYSKANATEVAAVDTPATPSVPATPSASAPPVTTPSASADFVPTS